jgi:hypothetical protein
VYVWVISPYLIAGGYLLLYSQKIQENNVLLSAISFASIGGIVMLIDVRYIHPDPQGFIGVMMIPVLQFAAFGLCNIIAGIVRK